MGDSALVDLILESLQSNPYLTSRNLRFEANSGRVTLKGTVASFYQKQMAQEAVRRVAGVAGVENQLEVHWPPCCTAAV